MSVLVVAEHLRGRLRPVSLELVTAARGLGGPVAVAVVARDPHALAAAVDVEGVDEILAVPVEQEEPERFQRAVETLVAERRPRAVLLGFTASSLGWGAALALRLEAGFAADVFALRDEGGGIVAERPFAAGRLAGELDFPGRERVVLLLRPGAWAPAGGRGGAAVTEVAVGAGRSRVRHRGWIEAPADADLETADLLLSVGRGAGGKDVFDRLERLAAAMGATLAVSRPVVDAGWASSARLVGQSGSAVAPKVYLALGISGAVQHVAGMQRSGTIVAVNTDPRAPIFSVAHYGAVADLEEVAEALERLYRDGREAEAER